MRLQNTRAGIMVMIGTMFIFAIQDAMSRHLSDSYNVFMVIMIRYWAFTGFVLMLSSMRPGGVRAAARSTRPWLQIARGALLAIEVIVMIIAFVRLGLVEAHALFAVYPLIVTALSGPILGERVGWRRWLGVAVGLSGVLIILQPGAGVIDPNAAYALIAAAMFAVYSVLNRYVAHEDPAPVTFFYTGVSGAVVMTVIGAWFWEPMTAQDWVWMVLLCGTGTLGHYMLIRAYELAEASAIQPFAYFQLPFAATLGIVVFGDILRPNVALGTAIVVGAGIFTFIRAQIVARSNARKAARSG